MKKMLINEKWFDSFSDSMKRKKLVYERFSIVLVNLCQLKLIFLTPEWRLNLIFWGFFWSERGESESIIIEHYYAAGTFRYTVFVLFEKKSLPSSRFRYCDSISTWKKKLNFIVFNAIIFTEASIVFFLIRYNNDEPRRDITFNMIPLNLMNSKLFPML